MGKEGYTSKYTAVYISKYTERKVTAPQYLADFIMERIAAKEKTVLTYKYWNDERWKATYLAQLAHANALLKEASIVSILDFLRNHYRGKQIFSLGLKKNILQGCKEGPKHSNGIIVHDDVMEDLSSLEVDDEENNSNKRSLWEKL